MHLVHCPSPIIDAGLFPCKFHLDSVNHEVYIACMPSGDMQTSDVNPPTKAVCYLCKQEVSPPEDFFCHGCYQYICDRSECDENLSLIGPHAPEDHKIRSD